MILHTLKNIKIIFLAVLLNNFSVDDTFSNPVVLCRGENTVYKFIEAILKEHNSCKKFMKVHFNQNLIMSEESEKKFQSSNKCWICNKLFTDEDKKVRDHKHVTGKYRGSADSDCDINLKLTKTVPVIFHNLRGYGCHLIMPKICKFHVKVDVIPNGLEKYMAFIINKNLVFIDSMQFMNSSFNALVKNLTDNGSKYLSQGFNGEQRNLIK